MVYILMKFHCFTERNESDFTIHYPDHYTFLVIDKSLHCGVSQAAALTLSLAEGDPPRWRCPSTETLTSNSLKSFFTFSAMAKAPPSWPPSATIIILLDFLRVLPASISDLRSWSAPLISGIIIASAPVAIPLYNAINPASAPITSTKNILLWALAVSLILSLIHI